jgi:hypothetical protein
LCGIIRLRGVLSPPPSLTSATLTHPPAPRTRTARRSTDTMSIRQRHLERDHSQRCTRVCGNRMCVVTLPRFALHRCQTSLVQGAHRSVQGCAAIGCASSPCLASLCTVVRPHLCKALTEVYKGVRQSGVRRHPASLRFAPLSDLTCVMSSSQCQHAASSRAIVFGAPVCTLTFPPPTNSHHTTSHYTLFAHAGIGGCGKIDTQKPCWRVIQSQASRVGSPHHDGVCVCVCVCVFVRACVRA